LLSKPFTFWNIWTLIDTAFSFVFMFQLLPNIWKKNGVVFIRGAENIKVKSYYLNIKVKLYYLISTNYMLLIVWHVYRYVNMIEWLREPSSLWIPTDLRKMWRNLNGLEIMIDRVPVLTDFSLYKIVNLSS
jgi:hypothetical protein